MMPYLKETLLNYTDKSNQLLCAKSMECISVVGTEVGKEKFGQDVTKVHCGLNLFFCLIDR